MPERLTLATPITKVVDGYSISQVVLDVAGGRIQIDLIHQGTGEVRSIAYAGPTALAILRALNKADLSTKSLQRRILERLMADGHLAGTIVGDPD